MSTTNDPVPAGALNVDQAVRERYSVAAANVEPKLCCPVQYHPKYLEVIPEEILERDYGCGDPSQYLNEGEVVLDLGSGGGKICFIASQVVGAKGRVIGVDGNDDMLALAGRHRQTVADRIGYSNVEFRKGRIQDLRLDLEKLDRYLAQNPVRGSSDWLRLQEHARHLCLTAPMIADESIDVIISNCVLNLVATEDRVRLFQEMHRVLRPGGRAVISDIVADEDVPQDLQGDARLWSGCISGAFREDRFLAAFEQAGFYGVEIIARQAEPWAVVEGIEFRSLTVRAFRRTEGPRLERRQAVVYNGPWKEVVDDDGCRLLRGQRMAVCDRTYSVYARAPYTDQLTLIPPRVPVPEDQACRFVHEGPVVRSARETKQGSQFGDTLPVDRGCCGDSGCC